MNGNSFVLDTNAILYILDGDEALAELLYGEKLYASIISEMELLSYPEPTAKGKQQIRSFLADFEIVGIDEIGSGSEHSGQKEDAFKAAGQHHSGYGNSIGCSPDQRR